LIFNPLNVRAILSRSKWEQNPTNPNEHATATFFAIAARFSGVSFSALARPSLGVVDRRGDEQRYRVLAEAVVLSQFGGQSRRCHF
jgi:hypothetical protein